MNRPIGTHAGCGGAVVAPAGYRYCRRCMLTSHVTSIDLTLETPAPACRQCDVVLTADNVGQWPATGCCLDCEGAAITAFIAGEAA